MAILDEQNAKIISNVLYFSHNITVVCIGYTTLLLLSETLLLLTL
jgi:hypothetical protein